MEPQAFVKNELELLDVKMLTSYYPTMMPVYLHPSRKRHFIHEKTILTEATLSEV